MNTYKLEITMERDGETVNFSVDDSKGEKLSQLEAVNMFTYLAYALKAGMQVEKETLFKCLTIGTSENFINLMSGENDGTGS